MILGDLEKFKISLEGQRILVVSGSKIVKKAIPFNGCCRTLYLLTVCGIPLSSSAKTFDKKAKDGLNRLLLFNSFSTELNG
jgi:hypothetical protein